MMRIARTISGCDLYWWQTVSHGLVLVVYRDRFILLAPSRTYVCISSVSSLYIKQIFGVGTNNHYPHLKSDKNSHYLSICVYNYSHYLYITILITLVENRAIACGKIRKMS